MTHTYNISGLTCNNCVAKAKSELLKLGDITSANVQLNAPQATLSMQKHIPVQALQNALHKAGNYTISEAHNGMHHTVTTEEQKSWIQTYKPIVLIFGYLLLISVIVATSAKTFNWMSAMRVFMSGFFLSFSFFKMLNLKAFAESYSSYDIIAKRFTDWGLIYAFIELTLGVAYAINFQPLLTNAIAFAVMSISIVGVLQSVLSKRKIQCACLGAVFNLPMSTVTIIEDAMMIAMSGIMIVNLIL